MVIEIVSFPYEKWWIFPVRYVNVYQICETEKNSQVGREFFFCSNPPSDLEFVAIQFLENLGMPRSKGSSTSPWSNDLPIGWLWMVMILDITITLTWTVVNWAATKTPIFFFKNILGLKYDDLAEVKSRAGGSSAQAFAEGDWKSGLVEALRNPKSIEKRFSPHSLFQR